MTVPVDVWLFLLLFSCFWQCDIHNVLFKGHSVTTRFLRSRWFSNSICHWNYRIVFTWLNYKHSFSGFALHKGEKKSECFWVTSLFLTGIKVSEGLCMFCMCMYHVSCAEMLEENIFYTLPCCYIFRWNWVIFSLLQIICGHSLTGILLLSLWSWK